MSADREPEYELAMPFVLCASAGGPYDDDAFVAGWECCKIDHLLENGRFAVTEETVRTDNLPQLDLIAMRYGFTMEVEHADGGWTIARFTKTALVS